MKRLLLAGVACVSASIAHAQIPVTDGGLIMQQTWSNINTALSWIQQGEQMVSQLKQLEQQYAAIAHLPQNIASMASSLANPGLQDPLPVVTSIPGIVSGTALGAVSGTANALMSVNQFFAPQGNDFTAQEMQRAAQGTAGLQAMAIGSMSAIQQRIAALQSFMDCIGSSPDVQQTAAIQARLQLEQNYVAAQQVQAQQLLVMASAQQQVAEQRAEQKQRQDAEQYQQMTSGVPLP